MTIEAPPGSIGVSMRKGVASALRLDGQRILLARRLPDGTWTDHSTVLDRPWAEGDLKGLPLTLNETGPDLGFFATNFILGFQHHGDVSPCSLWKLDEATSLKPQGLVPLELDGPVFLPRKGVRKGAVMDLAPRLAGLAPFLDHPVRVEGASIIVSLGAGVLWVVKDGSKRADPVIRLSPPGPGGLEGRDIRPPAIHGLLPLPGGHVIIALRPSGPAQGKPRSMEPVIWKVVNPMTGTVANPSADLIRDAPRTLASGHRLRFTVDSGGRLRFRR
ncbi:hypothetical protein [Mesoterricola silvestris]|uniref:hypothetical protein n=1 Tax=Mesoterricola silvestris TaxID=2927979 RepID=UPI00292F3EB0|nr:hypothetical protein [Mesoterricola silvestris]